MGDYEKTPGDVIPIQRGFDKKRELEMRSDRLDARIREIFEYRQDVGERYKASIDPVQQERLSQELYRLDAKIEAGSLLLERLKAAKPEEVEAYIAEGYKALK